MCLLEVDGRLINCGLTREMEYHYDSVDLLWMPLPNCQHGQTKAGTRRLAQRCDRVRRPQLPTCTSVCKWLCSISSSQYVGLLSWRGIHSLCVFSDLWHMLVEINNKLLQNILRCRTTRNLLLATLDKVDRDHPPRRNSLWKWGIHPATTLWLVIVIVIVLDKRRLCW